MQVMKWLCLNLVTVDTLCQTGAAGARGRTKTMRTSDRAPGREEIIREKAREKSHEKAVTREQSQAKRTKVNRDIQCNV